MVNHCVAYRCLNRSEHKIPGVTFHSFPKNEALKQKWIKNMRRPNWTPSLYDKLCSKHFEDEMIDRSTSRVRLRESAIPTIFVLFPSVRKEESGSQELSVFQEEIGEEEAEEIEAQLVKEINSMGEDKKRRLSEAFKDKNTSSVKKPRPSSTNDDEQLVDLLDSQRQINDEIGSIKEILTKCYSSVEKLAMLRKAELRLKCAKHGLDFNELFE